MDRRVPLRTALAGGAVLAHLPDWARKAVPGTRAAWAPDISFFNGRHHLYYALSGAPTLRIQPLAWTSDSWPVAV